VSRPGRATAALSLALLLAIALPAAAAPAPHFSGRWRLDVAASDFGKGHRVPSGREDVIAQAGPWVSVHSRTARAAADTLKLDYRYRTDGEAVNTLMGQEVRTRGWRDGTSLRFDSVTHILLLELGVAEHWSLSADDGTFTLERESRSPLGNERQRLVFHREP
jgi:hypothetical protein